MNGNSTNYTLYANAVMLSAKGARKNDQFLKWKRTIKKSFA